jgi:hypothetical protein
MNILEFLGFKVSASSLKQKASNALDSFTKVMEELKEINEQSSRRQVKLKQECLTIQEEISELNNIMLANDKVVGNIEKILK